MAALVVGDLLVLFAFVATGQISHGYAFWEAPARTVLITVPIAFGWLALAVPAGLFVPGKLRLDAPSGLPVPAGLRRVMPRLPVSQNLPGLVWTVSAVWIGAILIVGAIRSTSLVPGSAPVVFLLVNTVFGAAFLLPWRVLVGWHLAR